MEEREIRSLVEKARLRDADALATLCERIYPEILKYMSYRVDAQLAEDLASEVFVHLVRSIHTQRGSFVAWIYRIANNVIIDYLRREKSRKDRLRAANDSPERTNRNNDPSQRVEHEIDLREAIKKLTEEQRKFVILKFIQGLSNSEIAEIMDRNVGALRALQFRALKMLRDLLSGEER